MEIVLESAPGLNKKGILAWNFHQNWYVDSIGNRGGDKTSMVIQKAGAPGQACGTGADTVVLGSWEVGLLGWQAHYYFPPQDFWDFWGGCKVTFMWFTDQAGSGVWGPQTTLGTHVPRGAEAGQHAHETDPAHGRGLLCRRRRGGVSNPTTANWASAAPTPEHHSIRAPRCLQRRRTAPWFSNGVRSMEVHVIYGGHPFFIQIYSLQIFTLGFDWSRVRAIPFRGLFQLPDMPFDGTLLREQKTAPVRLEGTPPRQPPPPPRRRRRPRRLSRRQSKTQTRHQHDCDGEKLPSLAPRPRRAGRFIGQSRTWPRSRTVKRVTPRFNIREKATGGSHLAGNIRRSHALP